MPIPVRLWATVIFCIVRAHSDFEDHLSSVAAEIVRLYYRDCKCIVQLFEGWEGPLSVGSSSIVLNLNSGTWSQKLLRRSYDENCKCFIVRLSPGKRSAVTNDLIDAYKKSSSSRYNKIRYLYLPMNHSDEDSSFLDGPVMYYMPEIVFVASAPTGFAVVSHNFFDGHQYDTLKRKTRVVDVWHPRSGFRRNADLYPDTLENLHGKRMVFSIVHYNPYVLLTEDGDRMKYDGLEMRLMEEFVRMKNATWTAILNPIHLWGEIFDNGTGNGIVGSIYEDSADMGFAGIYQWYCDVIDCTYPYIQSEITCLAPKPLVMSGWYTIVLPFEFSVWINILSAYLLSSLFMFLIFMAEHNINWDESPSLSSMREIFLSSFFKIIRIQLEQTTRDPEHKSIKTFLKIWTVYCFFIAVLWRGGMASFLTVPRYEDPINDVRDLTSKWPGVQWGATHIDWIESIEQSTEPETMKIVEKFLVLDEATIRQRIEERSFAAFMERLPNGHFGVGDYIDESMMRYLRIMEKYIYIGNCVIILPKCSPYTESLDKMLFSMMDTGLIQKLEVQISLEGINNALQNMIRRSTEQGDHEKTALLISHIQGALLIYATGISLSVTVFILEIVVKCYIIHIKKKKIIRECNVAKTSQVG